MHELPPASGKPVAKGLDKGIQWNMLSRPEIETLVNGVQEAVTRKDLPTLQKYLERPENLRSLVVSRGKKNLHLDLLENGFDLFLDEQSGPGSDILALDQNGRYRIGAETVLELVHKLHLPEQILSELTASAYHKRDGARFFRLLSIIMESADALTNKDVYYQAQHALASWRSSVEQNAEGALGINKEVLTAMNVSKSEDRTLETKLRFGLTHDKALKPKDKAETYGSIAEAHERSGIHYEALRARVEAARMYLELAKRQTGNSKTKEERMHNLGTALTLAENVAQEGYQVSYANLEVLAHRVLGGIYEEMGDQNQAKKHKNAADGLARRFRYQTKD